MYINYPDAYFIIQKTHEVAIQLLEQPDLPFWKLIVKLFGH